MKTVTLAAQLTAIALVTAQAQGPPVGHRGPLEHERLAKAILRQLVEIDTTQAGSTTPAADAVAARLRDAGFAAADVQVLGPTATRQNLVARLRGRSSGRKPVLVMAHLDVVDAHRQDWTVDPFTFTEREGWFYGRGTMDDKDEAAIWTASLIRLRRESYVPDRDIVLMLTADEEAGAHNGVEWLLRNHRSAIDAALALNEGGGGVIKQGRRLAHNLQASEKTYQNFELLVTNSGGHSSLPRADNAISQLAGALTRLQGHRFPVMLGDVTRAFFQRTAAIESAGVAAVMGAILRDPADRAADDVLSAFPEYNARLRTTCVPTRVEAGHAENALPQRARAIINCRIVPGDTPARVLAALTQAIADPGVAIRPTFDAQMVAPSPLVPDVLGPVEEITHAMWPGVAVIPTMGTTATDGFYLRRAGIPVYGVSGVFDDPGDVRAHGRDERIHATWFYDGLEFSYRLIKRLTGGE